MKKLKISNFQFKLLLFLLPFIPIILNRYLDNDFWFTINQGRYVIEHGFPTTVLFTVHDNLDFIYQSWGTGVIFYTIYNLFGDFGVITLMIIIGELTLYFFYKLCYEVSKKRELSYFITALTMAAYFKTFLTTRPHIFTSLNIVILLYLLEKYSNTNNKKYILLLPLISLIEVNMHGMYFFMTLIYTLPYIVDLFKIKIFNIETRNTKNKDLIIIFIIMFLTGFINPYTYKTVLYVFNSFGNHILKNTIIELIPLNIVSHTPMFLGLILVFFGYYFSKKKIIKMRYFLLVLGSTILTFESIKSFNFFLLGAVFPLVNSLDLKIQKLDDKLHNKNYYICNIFLFMVLLCIIISNYNPIKPGNNKAILYLKSNYSTNMTVYTEFYEGSYIEYLGYKCYIDPRAEVFLKVNNHKKDIYAEYIKLDFGHINFNYKKFLNEYNFDILFVNKKNGLYKVLKKNKYNYKLVYSDKSYQIYERASK